MQRTPLLASPAFGVLWLIVGLVAADTTFHIAPGIVAGASTLATAKPTPRTVGYGLGVAGVTGFWLWSAGALDGPSLLPRGGAVLESVVVGVLGAAVGWGVAVSTRHRDEPSERVEEERRS
ncbi:MAG: hypothetical protein OEX04_15025 [Acidimicrobiia bacterium]|nr:hypothetical protein [Acidimicrobiia bacterium]MDH4308778.1 hypothetical protein [Acidimicrobiia bacterium]